MQFGGYTHLQRPRGGLHGALDVCGAMVKGDALASDHHEPLSQALQHVIKLQHGANRVLLISDGQCSDELARHRLLEMMRHTAVRLLVVADALELTPVPAGHYPIEHEGQRRILVLQSARQRESFQQGLGAGQLRLVATAQSLGIPHRLIDTAADPLDAVTALLRDGGKEQ
jgi:hypothetical protein